MSLETIRDTFISAQFVSFVFKDLAEIFDLGFGKGQIVP
jgi:hypothetical protein